MSFAAPLVLICLAGDPACSSSCTASHLRDRRRAAAAFAAPALTASVAPHRPRWRSHVPMLAFLLALAILILAAARPQKTVAVPVERASIMLITDVSGSMQATDVRPTRLVAARIAAKRFVAKVPKTVNVGVMALSSKPRVLASPTRDRVAINAALDQLAARGGTGTGEAIQAATNILRRQPGVNGKRPPAAIVLLSDGAATGKVDPVAAAQAARKLRIPIYTVALGTAQGTITVPRPGDAGGTRDAPGAARPAVARRGREGLGRQDVHRRRREQAQRRLQEPGLAPGHQEREAPDHGGLRRRRPRPAPARRRACRCAGSAA